MSEQLSKQRYNSADVRELFRHVANIIQKFKNPTTQGENRSDSDWEVQLLKRPDGTVYGFVDSSNVIYLNPNEVNINTPIHEFGHLWVSNIKNNQPDLYDRAMGEFTDSPYLKEVKADPNYSNLDETKQLGEAIARTIGDNGERVIKKVGVLDRIKQWLKDVWQRIGSAFGVQNLTSEQIAKLTWQDITDIATSELLSGEDLMKKKNQQKKAMKALQMKQINFITQVFFLGKMALEQKIKLTL